MSSSGTTLDNPPPVAPPFNPKTGPNEGSLSANIGDLPMNFRPCASPIDVVVFPSPAGVGLMAVTKMSLPSFLCSRVFMTFKSIFALY